MNILPDGVNWTLPATIPAFPFLGQQPQEQPSSRSLSHEDRLERGSGHRSQSSGRSSSRGRSQQGYGGQSRARSDERRREGQRTQSSQFGTGEPSGLPDMNFLNCLQPSRPEGSAPPLPSRGSSSRELITDDDAAPMLARHVKQMARETMSMLAKSWHFKVGLLLAAAFSCIGCGILLIVSGNDAGNALDLMPTCSETVPCPGDWKNYGSRGGYFCEENGGCRPGASGPWNQCLEQCYVQAPGGPPPPRLMPLPPAAGLPADAVPAAPAAETAPAPAPESTSLTHAGLYDLRVIKEGKLLGCAAPVGKFPGQPKYGCAGDFATAKTCDAAKDPVKDTKYVAAVHDGCETALGRGTYGYAYDDGVGLKQCAPITKYEWVLCPEGNENLIMWQAEPGVSFNSTKRFRVTNKCSEPIWIQQAGSAEEVLPGEEAIQMIEPGYSHTYSIPNKGLPSTRFLPKTGCDSTGNNCDIQSMPPCPETGCDLPIDTKFEASWGCQYWTGKETDKQVCALTGQGNPSTYQDWWDGSAVDGWTLPFTVLVDDANHGLAPGSVGTPDICGPVVCANLIAANICPTDEYLTPEVA